MEKIEIRIRKGNLPKLKRILDDLDYLESYKITEGETDIVSLASEPSLAEEWDSEEDSRWDNFL
jgi:hypothetical protein